MSFLGQIHFLETFQSPYIVLKKAVKNTVGGNKQGFTAGFGQYFFLTDILDYFDIIIKMTVLFQVIVDAFAQPVGAFFIVDIIVLARYKKH